MKKEAVIFFEIWLNENVLLPAYKTHVSFYSICIHSNPVITNYLGEAKNSLRFSHEVSLSHEMKLFFCLKLHY